MFPLIRLAMQVFLKPYSLGDKASCKKFLENLLALVKPLAAQTNTQMDDKILKHLEYILKTDALFDWFYQLIVDQFSSNDLVFEEMDETELVTMIEQSSQEPLPEAINPLLIISFVTQIISLINALKKARLEY